MENLRDSFLLESGLPQHYLSWADTHFSAAIKAIIAKLAKKQPLLIGINGLQGSGKTSLAAYLQMVFAERGIQAVNVSIDDFYLSKTQRQHLSRTVHPLLATRGVPGTHNMPLALQTFKVLRSHQPCRIPRFDKSIDDCLPQEQWLQVERADVVILEGWCVGAIPQQESELINSCNHLEETQDADGNWRRYVNEQLKGDYQQLFSMMDCWLMLKAANFDCVYQWRLQQETALLKKMQLTNTATDKKLAIMSPDQVLEFVQYFQRLSEHILKTLPEKMDYVYSLDAQRNIVQTGVENG